MHPQLGYQNLRLRRRLISKQRVIMLGPILLALIIFPGNKVGPPIIGGGEPALLREWLHPQIEWTHQSWEPSMAWHVSPTCVLGDREGAKRTREYTNKQNRNNYSYFLKTCFSLPLTLLRRASRGTVSKCPEVCDLQGDRGLGTGGALSSKPMASRISLTSLPSGLLFCRATPTTWGMFWKQTREGDHWAWIPISGSQCTQPVVPRPACTLESPAELHHTLRAGPHCQRFWLNWPGVRPRPGYALKSPQVILMCGQGWDLLYHIQQESPSGLHSDSSYF